MAPTKGLVVTTGASLLCLTAQLGYHTTVINVPINLIQQFINQSLIDRESKLLVTDGDITDQHILFLVGLVVSIYMLGSIFGNFLTFTIADRFGRKPTLFFAPNICFLSGCILQLCSASFQSPECLIVGRFIIGVGTGISLTIYSIFITEASPPEYTGMLGSLQSLALEFGGMVGTGVSQPQLLGNQSNWPYMLSWPMFLSVIHGLLYLFVPETPKFLFASDAAVEKIKRSLRFYNESDDHEEILHSFHVEKSFFDSLKSMDGDASDDKPAGRPSLREILNTVHYRMPLAMSVLAITVPACGSFFIILLYSTEVLHLFGLDLRTAQLASLVIMIVNFASSVLAPWTVHKFKRRTVLLSGLIVIGASNGIAFLGVLALKPLNEVAPGYLVAVCFTVIISIWTHGPGPVPLFLPAEISPSSVRSFNTSIALLTQGIVVFVQSFLFLPLFLQIHQFCFLLASLITFGGTFLLYKYLPESKNRTLVEIWGTPTDHPKPVKVKKSDVLENDLEMENFYTARE